MSSNLTYEVPFADRIAFETQFYVQTFYSYSPSGKPFFCYIRCNMDGYKKMHEDFLNKVAAAATSYGEVIYIDEIPEPDEKAKAFLKQWMAENSAK